MFDYDRSHAPTHILRRKSINLPDFGDIHGYPTDKEKTLREKNRYTHPRSYSKFYIYYNLFPQ